MSNEVNLVLKFGGSSVGTPQRIADVVRIVKVHPRSQSIVAVVVSAFQGVTDTLGSIANLAASRHDQWNEEAQLLFERHRDAAVFLSNGHVPKELESHLRRCGDGLSRLLERIWNIGALPKNILDEVLSYGERLSAEIVAQAFRQQGVPSKAVDARSMIKTDGHFGCAGVLHERTTPLIRKHLKVNGEMPIVTGFIGSTIKEETTTLGRGGSDYTATIVAAALDDCTAEIWTDTDGVMTADPKRVPQAKTVRHLTYEEAERLFQAGALVVYPPTVDPARRKNLTVSVRNTFRPDEPGTIIDGITDESTVPKGVASRNSTVLCSLRRENGTEASLSAWIDRLLPEASPLCVALASPPDGRGVAIHTDDLEQVRRMEEGGLFERGSLVSSCAVITLVGNGICDARIEEKAKRLLSAQDIPVLGVARGGGGTSLGFVVSSDQEQRTVELLHGLVSNDEAEGRAE